MTIMKATDIITVVEGYDAMRISSKPFGGPWRGADLCLS
jgi:hypothetical protein